jgi:hypothetical protein
MYAYPVYAEVTRFIFSTQPQTVLPNTLSKPLSIQSENGTGIPEEVTETTDLVFTSTSQTGEFVNSVGKKVNTTMSKHTSRRSVYYRDSSTGNHVLTLRATGRTSHKQYTAQQSIFIGKVAQENQQSVSLVSTTTDPGQLATTSVGHSNVPSVPHINQPLEKKIIKESTKLKENTVSQTKKEIIKNVEDQTQQSTVENNVATVYVGTAESSIMDTFLSIPKKLWDMLVSVFT